MRGIKPNKRIWKRINKAMLGENAAEVLVTLISGVSMILVKAGVAPDERQARVHLAAMLLSPDDGEVGSLAPLLIPEFEALRKGSRSWWQ